MVSTWPHFPASRQSGIGHRPICWSLGFLSTFPWFSKLNFGHRNTLWGLRELILEWLTKPFIYWCSFSFCPPITDSSAGGMGFPSWIIGIPGPATESKQWLRGRDRSWIIFPATLNELQTAGEQPSSSPGNFNCVFCQKGAQNLCIQM